MPVDISFLGVPAYIVSVTGAALGLTKIALWVKGGTGTANGNGKIMMAHQSGQFEGQIITLTERVVDLTASIHKGQREDRQRWGPALESLMASQNRLMEQFDEHSSQTHEAWQEILGEFTRLVDKIGELPCADEEEV